MSKKMELVVANPTPNASAQVDPSASTTATTPVTMDKLPDPKPPEQGLFPKSPVASSLPVPEAVDKTLAKILSWKRAHLTESELAFRKWLKDEIKARGGVTHEEEQGCILVQVRHPLTEQDTLAGEAHGRVAHQLFSCHIDTMHDSKPKKDEAWYQDIEYDANFGHIFLAKKDKVSGNCLGADDGAGVWIMLEMIAAQVPGNYLFHVGEERGFIGANAMKWNRKDWLKSFKHAIAFDRPVADDVVTHQGAERCCSDKFSEALAAALNEAAPGLTMAGKKHGGVTDTSKYLDLIPECTNVGVGYWQQHGQNETLNYAHLVALRDACIRVDWATLPCERDPSVKDYTSSGWGHGTSYYGQRGNYQGTYNRGRQGSLGLGEDGDDWDTWKSKQKSKGNKPKTKQTVVEPTLNQELEDMTWTDVLDFVETTPTEAASLLIDLASEVAALTAKVKYLKGVLK